MQPFARDVDFKAPRRPRRGTGGTLADLLDTATAPAAEEPDAATTPEPEPTPEAAAPADSAPLVFLESELPTMLAAAATAARGDALEATHAATEALAAEAQSAICQALATEVEARQAAHRQDADLIIAIAEAIARHVVPQALATAPLADLNATLPTLLARLDHPSRLEVRVAPSLVDPLEAQLATMAQASAFDGEINVQADAAQAPGAALVRWPDGEAKHSPTDLIDEATTRCAAWLAERDAAPAHADAQEMPDEH